MNEIIITRILVCIGCISVVKCQGDLRGTVNVGQCIVSPDYNRTDPTPQLIPVTENLASSTLPVYFLQVNNSLPDLECLCLEEDVLVSCSTKNNYTDGDSIIDFVADVFIGNGADVGYIPFSIIQQGRAVEVECTGETISAPGIMPPLFASNTSAGINGEVVVKKSPIVSFCDSVIVVPNAVAITTGNIQLQLSEPVREENVTVSCDITGITQDINGSQVWVTVDEGNDTSWMYLIFKDVYATIGTTDILLSYDIYRRGSLVLVTCYAESDNDASQYLKNTSASEATVFVLDTGFVHLLPQMSLVPTTIFTAFVVLNSPLKANEVDVTYSCYLVAVNDTLEARNVAEDPTCQPSDDLFNRPTALPTTSESSSACGNGTSCPPGTGPIDRPVITPINTTHGQWTLDESELIFTVGDVYKPVTVRLDSESGVYKGALVLTCCAAPDINTSPRFENTSAALLMLTDVTGYRPINWTSASVNPTKETVFANPAYVELSPCPCDLEQNRCERDCCCDQDCSEDELATFNCIPGIPGGDFTNTDAYRCDSALYNKPDYWPFMCIQISNSPYLGLYYSTVSGVRDLKNFNAIKAAYTDESFTSYRDLGKRTLEFVDDENNKRLYKNGYPVEQLYSDDVRGYLSLPERAPGGGCLWTSPLKYQEDFDSNCELIPDQKLCTKSSVLSAQMYVQASASSYPACPDAPKVVSRHRSSNVAPTDVLYYCTEDVSGYFVSNRSTADVLHPNRPSLFQEVDDEDDDVESTTDYPRCVWDDGYTRPPLPVYNSTTKLCHNAVLDVQYKLFWRGGEIVSVEADLLLGSIGLMQNTKVQVQKEKDDIDFVSPPPITPPPTTESEQTTWYTSIIYENITEIVTNFTEYYENVTFTEIIYGNMSDVNENYTGIFETGKTTLNPVTMSQATTKAATANPITTKPVTNPTTRPPPTTIPNALTTNPAVPPTVPTPTGPRGDTPAPSGLPTPPVASTPTPMSTTSSPTIGPSSLESSDSDLYVFVQYYSAKFIHLPERTVDPDTGYIEEPKQQYTRSGNPGYIIGSRVLSGFVIRDYIPDFDYDCAVNSTDNCTFPTSYPGINGSFVVVDDTEESRFKVWAPGPGSLCSNTSAIDVPFGEDLMSGCILRLGLAELQNCSILREVLLDQLVSLVPSDAIGKKGNANVTISEDWAPLYGVNDEPYEPIVNSTSSPDDPMTTPDPLTTRYPGQRYIQDPIPSQIADQLSGVCFDMPTGINIEILIADVGQNRGTTQQEILGARVTYTYSKLQLQCAAASGASCHMYSTTIPGNETNDNNTNSNSSIPDEQWVQSFLMTSTVTYTKVPAQEPKPPLLYQLGKDQDLCGQDACWDNALYPFTRAFEGDSYQYTLAVTLLTIFFSIGYIAITQPWWYLP